MKAVRAVRWTLYGVGAVVLLGVAAVVTGLVHNPPADVALGAVIGVGVLQTQVLIVIHKIDSLGTKMDLLDHKIDLHTD